MIGRLGLIEEQANGLNGASNIDTTNNESGHKYFESPLLLRIHKRGIHRLIGKETIILKVTHHPHTIKILEQIDLCLQVLIEFYFMLKHCLAVLDT